MRRVPRLPAALIWPGLALVYLMLPGHPLGLLKGLPFGMLELGLGLVSVLAAWCGARPPRRFFKPLGYGLILACGAKLLLAALALPYGLSASYVAGSDLSRPPERSTEWRLDGATRVDPSPSLVADQLPLHFFNDQRRFNYFRASEPRRDLLPFGVTWRGWLIEPDATRRCLRLEANGTAALRLEGIRPLAVERAPHLEVREVCGSLPGGAAEIEVRYVRPPDGVPYLRASEQGPNGEYRPLDSGRLLRTPATIGDLERDLILARLARVIDAAVALVSLALLIAWLGTLVGDRGRLRSSAERLVLALAILAAFAEGLVAQAHFAGRTAILSGGNDWLAYETYARDALLNGPLVNAGRPLGQGETFYYQPLYIYFLAALHWLLGESLHGPLVAQYVLAAVSGVLVYYLGRELFGRAAAWTGFALFWVFRYLVFNPIAALLLSENLVVLLIPPMLMLFARWQRTWRGSDLIGAGVLLGLAILTRSTPLLLLPLALVITALAQLRKFGQRRPALGAASLLLAVALLVVSLVPIRNLLVAGRPALLPESASANLWEAHRPSDRVNLARIERDPLYDRLGLDRQTREVVEYARQDPLGYGASLAVQGLYAIGITGPALGASTPRIQYELLALSAFYVAGILFVPAVRAAPVWILHAFVLTHVLQLMIFFAHQYGFRLAMPMYGPMIAVAGATLAALCARLGRVRLGASFRSAAPRPGKLLAGLALLLATLWSGWQHTHSPDVEAHVFGLGGDAAPSARALADLPESWSADRLYFAGQDGRSRAVAYLPGLAYREMKWIDAASALVWPAEGKQALLVRPSGAPAPLTDACWAPTAQQPRIETADHNGRVVQWLPPASERRCALSESRLASFGGVIDLLEARRDARDVSDDAALVVWRVVHVQGGGTALAIDLVSPDSDAPVSHLLSPFPSDAWEPGDLVVVRAALPRTENRAAVGFVRLANQRRLTIDDPLRLYGQPRYPIDE